MNVLAQRGRIGNRDVARTLLKNQYVASVTDKTAGLNNLITVVGFRDTVANTRSLY